MVGTTLGRYRVERALGSGGMGDVYVAEDLTLNRKVALKVLPERHARDVDALDRFEREARALAALNHPGIVTVHSVEESDGVHFITMELAAGQPLSNAIPQTGFPVRQAIGIALGLADALAAAHRSGVVHRDVKPGNVVLTPSGVKVLDFGLAKLVAPDASSSIEGETALTRTGLIVGTPQYMAPEQIEGHAVDHRVDIFALGTVLYEMLTGRPPFEASSIAGVMAATLTRDAPPISERRPDAPSLLDAIVRKCLAKNPDDRWQSVRDLRDALQWARDTVPDEGAPQVRGLHQRAASLPGLSAVAATLVVGAALVLAALPWLRGASDDAGGWASGQVRFTLTGTGPHRDLALSPDGRRLAFVAPAPTVRSALWIRDLGSSDARMIPGTEGATRPFWSPDGRSIAFHADGALKRIASAGGAAQVLHDVPVGLSGGSWGEDVLVFALRQVLYRIPATGGTATPITELDRARRENSHRFPHFLPDGRRFLYVARSGQPDESGVYLASIDGGPATRLFSTVSVVRYAAPGYLLFVQDGVLMAQPFDAGSGRLKGEPAQLAASVGFDPWTLASDFTVAGGVLAYRQSDSQLSQLTWYDRSGRKGATVGEPGYYSYFRLDPSGQRIAADIGEPRRGSRSVWLLDAAGEQRSRLTFTGSHDWIPVWSPDGSRILFSSFREGPSNLYEKTTSGATPEVPVIASSEQVFGHDWSPDGRFVAYMQNNPLQNFDIYVRRVDGTGEPIAIANSEAIEFYPRLSPDGRWIAYGSEESGTAEVYVQPFPPTGGKWQISSGGGTQIRWRGDGRELYYLRPDHTLVAVDVRANSTFVVGSSRELFRVENAYPATGSNTYEPTRDGQRFLFNVLLPASTDAGTEVVLNWAAGLR